MNGDKLPEPGEKVEWLWLLRCQECGKPHHWRWINERWGTWRDPVDDHFYVTLGRGMVMEQYKKWKAEQE